MSIRKIATLPCGITIHRDSEFDEYQVRIAGEPNATYFTDDAEDAQDTARKMWNDCVNPAQAPKAD